MVAHPRQVAAQEQHIARVQVQIDALLKARGDGGQATKTDLRDCTQGMDAAQRRELLRVLERKQYLRVEGAGWLLCERGPMQIFD